MPKRRTKQFTTSFHCLDSFVLHHLYLKAQANATYTWNNIHLTLEGNRLYVKSLDKGINLSRLYILLNPMPCQYGGVRLMFICPLCRKNARKLYFRGIEFGCRRCFNLAYQSQNETLAYRLLRKKDKILNLLGKDKYEFTPKPKGMHNSTYKSLSQLVSTLEDLSLMAFLAKSRNLHSVPSIHHANPSQYLRPKWTEGTKQLVMSLLRRPL